MIAVIIAGGQGTRLWPLSTPTYPKHLLNLSGKESLLQGTYRRFKAISSRVYVITEASHAHLVQEQLPDLPESAFIIEPDRRGTANCFIAGLHKVATDKLDAEEPIAFVSADHFVRDTKGFAASFKVAETASKLHKKVTQVGIDPTYPATGLGYIHKNGDVKDGSLVYEVLSFKEKPPFDTAQAYVESGDYLWNCSYYVGSLNTFLRDMDEFAKPLKAAYQKLLAAKNTNEYRDTYLGFSTDTIDYAFAEHAPEGGFLVVPASFDWMDVGSFADMHQAVGGNQDGNYVKGNIGLHEVTNSYLHNNEDKPVAVIGLDNVVVVNTPDGILVARKDLSQKVKEVVQGLGKK